MKNAQIFENKSKLSTPEYATRLAVALQNLDLDTLVILDDDRDIFIVKNGKRTAQIKVKDGIVQCHFFETDNKIVDILSG